MNHISGRRCKAILALATLLMGGCGEDKPSPSTRERKEDQAKKEYAVEAAGKALALYGGYDKWEDVTVALQDETVIVRGLAMRSGAVHDFKVEFEKLESEELRLVLVQANEDTLHSVKRTSVLQAERAALQAERAALQAERARRMAPILAPILSEIVENDLSSLGYVAKTERTEYSIEDTTLVVTGLATKDGKSHEFECKLRIPQGGADVKQMRKAEWRRLRQYIKVDGEVLRLTD